MIDFKVSDVNFNEMITALSSVWPMGIPRIVMFLSWYIVPSAKGTMGLR